MEVSKACLMRCAVSGQRPGSLIVLEKHELTWWGGGLQRHCVLHSNKFKLEQSERNTTQNMILFCF